MSRISLSDTGDWKLEFPDDQDIRGYRALDKDGNPVGVVDTMIVNTDEERVDAVVLEDGTEYPARDLSIGDGVVYLTTVDSADGLVDEEVRVYGDYRPGDPSEDVEDGDYDAHADAFRSTTASSYGETGDAYEDYEPAYRYGFDVGPPGRQPQPELRRRRGPTPDGLRIGHADRDYDADRAAIRYGYTRAQHATR